MASESASPQGGGGGNAKYGLIGVLLIAAAIAVYFGMDCMSGGPPPVAEAPDAGTIERPTALQEPDLIMELEPDAGSEPDSGPVKTKIVYRYVRGDWDCAGEIPAAAASSVIRANRRQVRNCYERALKQNHTLAGTVSLRLRVGNTGGVTGVHVGGSLRDPAVFACVRNLANSWSFPAPSGGSCAVLAQGFDFTPQD